MGPLEAGDPRQVGPFELSGRLGSGGMGVVYAAWAERFGDVALKVVHAELARETTFLERFRHEVRTVAMVRGDHVAQFVAADLNTMPPWLATERLEGPTLGALVHRGGPLEAEAILGTVASGVARGLVDIHSHDTVHRDLKPSNVVMTDDSAKVIDFGIAFALEGNRLTTTGKAPGSAPFMSPEQAEGLAIGTASDIFSLGGLLFFAATGRQPFGEGHAAAVGFRIVSRDPDLSGIADPDLRDLISRCLAKDAAARPTAAQVAAEVAPYARARAFAGFAGADVADAPTADATVIAAAPARDSASPRDASFWAPTNAALISGGLAGALPANSLGSAPAVPVGPVDDLPVTDIPRAFRDPATHPRGVPAVETAGPAVHGFEAPPLPVATPWETGPGQAVPSGFFAPVTPPAGLTPTDLVDDVASGLHTPLTPAAGSPSVGAPSFGGSSFRDSSFGDSSLGGAAFGGTSVADPADVVAPGFAASPTPADHGDDGGWAAYTPAPDGPTSGSVPIITPLLPGAPSGAGPDQEWPPPAEPEEPRSRLVKAALVAVPLVLAAAVAAFLVLNGGEDPGGPATATQPTASVGPISGAVTVSPAPTLSPSASATPTLTPTETPSATPTTTPSASASRSAAPSAAPVAALAITSGGLPAGRVGSPYSAQLSAAGGKAPYRWALVATRLPAGLSLSSGGAISGTPSGGNGTTTFLAAVTDSAGTSVSALRSITVSGTATQARTGDLNGDSEVDCDDYQLLADDWGTGASRSDLNGDGTVNQADARILESNWTSDARSCTIRGNNGGGGQGPG